MLMALLYEQKEDRQGPYIEVTGYEGGLSCLFVPEEIEGLPVRSIAAHAFAGRKDLAEVRLPVTLKALHLFAFQNCTGLRRICLFNTTDDYYDGVIRGCSALRELEVTCVRADDYVIIREFLQDTDQALRFVLHLAGGETVSLTFPEYVSEAREDTMARAIHFTIEGGGMAYRECVGRHAIDYAGYDRLLPRLTEYDFRAGMDICIGRLRYPVELSDSAADRYRQYLTEHAEAALKALTAENDTDTISFLADRELIPEEAVGPVLRLCAEEKRTECGAILMDYRHRRMEQQGADAASGAGALSLGDW